MSNKKEKLLIIDGNALIHRSFHALPTTMTTKTGEIVNAVYGFTAFLMKAVKDLQPDYLVLTLDKKGKTFRHEAYAAYKATRTKAPQELYDQIGRVKEVAIAFGVPIYELSGFEADDLIGTICRTVDESIDKVILTGDMDTLQLVNEHTRVYTMSRGLNDSVLYDELAVRTRYGIGPDQIIDYKALRGDPSDNIPGVKGIGEKTAVELLQEYSTLDGLYKNIGKVEKERIRNLLIEHRELAYLSKNLATIKVDSPIEFDLESSRFDNFDQEAIVKLFNELEFRSLLNRLFELINKNGQTSLVTDKFIRDTEQFKYQLIDDEKKFKIFLKKLENVKAFTFDLETTGLDRFNAEILGIGFSFKEGEAYYVQIKNQKTQSKIQASIFDLPVEDKDQVNPFLLDLKPIFANAAVKKYGHNIKYDVSVLEANGVTVKGVEFDTMVAAYLINPGSRQYGLDNLAFSLFNFEKISKDDLLGKGKDKLEWAEVPTSKMFVYCCEDADFTNRLVSKLRGEMQALKLEKLYHKIELPLMQVLTKMELRGICLDVNFLKILSDKLHIRLKELEQEIYDEAGHEFNVNSPSQLKVVLFDELAISSQGIAKTKTGLSTAADELVKIRDEHPIVRFIEEYRELAKLTSTYLDALPLLVNSKTGRVHTSYNQTIAATGRLSSTDPNLQNIPVKSDWGREVRKAFVAPAGYKLLALDYSQIELRLAAHLSLDAKMIAAFKGNADIHTSTAAQINKVEIDEVTKDMRRAAKATNFGILYGQGPHGLSQAADIPYWQAKEFIDEYFVVFSGVKKYLDSAIKSAEQKGYAETMFNRKRQLPDINSNILAVKRAAERMAINMPIQGTAADMIKVAMIEVEDFLEKNYKEEEVKMLLQVHDELIFEVRDDLVEKVAPEIKKIMENVVKLKVPIVADIKSGKNWGEME
ncbi:MAG: DNA polymerase I [bacterium]